MDRFAKLVASAFFLFCGQHAWSGYAYPAPPPSVSGTVATPLVRAAANDSVVSRLIRTPVGPVVNVGGRSVTLPAAMRLAANASRFGAAGLHPLVIAGVVLSPFIIDWIKSGGFDVQSSQVVKADLTVCTVAPCFIYQTSVDTYHFIYNTAGGRVDSAWKSSKLDACRDGWNKAPWYITDLGPPSVANDSGPGTATGSCLYGEFIRGSFQFESVSPSPNVWLPVNVKEPDLRASVTLTPARSHAMRQL